MSPKRPIPSFSGIHKVMNFFIQSQYEMLRVSAFHAQGSRVAVQVGTVKIYVVPWEERHDETQLTT